MRLVYRLNLRRFGRNPAADRCPAIAFMLWPAVRAPRRQADGIATDVHGRTNWIMDVNLCGLNTPSPEYWARIL